MSPLGNCDQCCCEDSGPGFRVDPSFPFSWGYIWKWKDKVRREHQHWTAFPRAAPSDFPPRVHEGSHHATSSPTGCPHPGVEGQCEWAMTELLLFNLILIFYWCILIVQRGFTVVFHTCVYCILMTLTPHCFLFSHLLPPQFSTAFSGVPHTILTDKRNILTWLTPSFSFSLPFPLIPLGVSQWQSCHTDLHVCVYIYLLCW
jgi:hypothetical protein